MSYGRSFIFIIYLLGALLEVAVDDVLAMNVLHTAREILECHQDHSLIDRRVAHAG